MDMRVSMVEDPGPDPDMNFLPIFSICDDGSVHSHYTYRDVSDVGEKGVALVDAVLKIEGVLTLTISKHQLRVVKYNAFGWERDGILDQVQAAFRSVYGEGVYFEREHPVTLGIKRLKTLLDLKPKK